MKKITLMKNMAAAAIFALAISATVSCDPNEKNPGEDTTKYVLEFANPEDTDIVIEADAEELVTIALKLENLTPDQVKVEKKESDMTWCAASTPDSEGIITITPALENPNETDLIAGFIVSTTMPNVPSIEFTVTKKGNGNETDDYTVNTTCPDFVAGESEWDPIKICPNATGAKSVTITITTTAPYWYLNMMMDADWMTFDKTYGKSGETCTITFTDNRTVSERNAQISFNYNKEIDYMNMIMIQQPAAPATTAKVYSFDAETETSGEQLSTNHTVSLKATDTVFPFAIEADGGIDFKWAKTGTSEFFEPDYSYWISFGKESIYDDNWNTIGEYFKMISKENTTDTARTVDLVLVPAGGNTELFRFKITQAAADAE